MDRVVSVPGRWDLRESLSDVLVLVHGLCYSLTQCLLVPSRLLSLGVAVTPCIDRGAHYLAIRMIVVVARRRVVLRLGERELY